MSYLSKLNRDQRLARSGTAESGSHASSAERSTLMSLPLSCGAAAPDLLAATQGKQEGKYVRKIKFSSNAK